MKKRNPEKDASERKRPSIVRKSITLGGKEILILLPEENNLDNSFEDKDDSDGSDGSDDSDASEDGNDDYVIKSGEKQLSKY